MKSLAIPIVLLTSIACSPPPRETPGVSSEAFDGPGDRLTPAERKAFSDAANGVQGPVVRCIEQGYGSGVRSSEITARIRFRRDGHITAVGFKANPANESVSEFLACVRAAIASMDLSKGPWEADRSVVYRFGTNVETTWD